MKALLRTATGIVLTGSLIFLGSGTATAGEICSMGGTMVKVAVDTEKAVEWFEDERRSFLLDEDEWQLATISDANTKIALVLGEDYVFFGVADDRDDREADENRMIKAFGNDMKMLRGAIQKEIKALWKGQVIDIRGPDVQNIVEAFGIGVVSKVDREWVLETEDCDPVTVNLEDLED